MLSCMHVRTVRSSILNRTPAQISFILLRRTCIRRTGTNKLLTTSHPFVIPFRSKPNHQQYRYLTNDYWHFTPFWDGWKANGEGSYNAHMAEFCCEFSAELVDPTCPDNNGFPNAPAEKMICGIFQQELPKRACKWHKGCSSPTK